MKAMTATKIAADPNQNKYLVPVMILAGFLLVGFIIAFLTQQNLEPAGFTTVSQSDLEARYGLRVSLLALTAANGLVDLRLKVLNAEKARLLLQDAGDLPVLVVGDGNATLTAPEEGSSQLLNSLTDDAPIFLVYPNLGDAVKPGMAVTIRFGDVRLEPVPAR